METASLASPPAPAAATQIRQKGSRGLSAAEFAIGAAIVLLHNVWRLVPNEVPILFVLGWISIRLRDGGWKTIGLERPASWGRIVGIALAAAVIRLGVGELVIVPLASKMWHAPVESSKFNDLAHNPLAALLTLGVAWTFAAFGEEMVYRGYLLTRAADLGGRTRLAYWMALIPVSVLFGYGHFYKGYAGVVDSAFAGVVLAGAYLLSRRNLWAAILAHGFMDTIAVVVTFMGWAN